MSYNPQVNPNSGKQNLWATNKNERNMQMDQADMKQLEEMIQALVLSGGSVEGLISAAKISGNSDLADKIQQLADKIEQKNTPAGQILTETEKLEHILRLAGGGMSEANIQLDGAGSDNFAAFNNPEDTYDPNKIPSDSSIESSLV